MSAASFEALRASGRLDDTMIVFTSDHGEFLGDRGLGEKELFYDEVVRVPLIVVDPDARGDVTRGTVDVRLVEAIDLVPTFVEAIGRRPDPLRRTLADAAVARRRRRLARRRAVRARLRFPPRATGAGPPAFGMPRRRCCARRSGNTCTGKASARSSSTWRATRWSLPTLARTPAFEPVRQSMRERLLDKLATLRHRITVDDAEVAMRTDTHRARGIHIGICVDCALIRGSDA